MKPGVLLKTSSSFSFLSLSIGVLRTMHMKSCIRVLGLVGVSNLKKGGLIMLTNKNFSLSEGCICRGAYCGSCKPLVILVISN